MNTDSTDKMDKALVHRVPTAAYGRDALYAAAFSFIDRAHVRLERSDDAHVAIVLEPKSADLTVSVAEVEEALAAARLTLEAAEAGRAWVESVVLGSLGAPEPPAEAAPPLPELDADDLAAFDDPLGIAKSWEEKHKKP